MRRSRSLRILVAALVMLPLAGSIASPNGAAAAERPPNILIVLTDDQRDGMRFLPEVRRFFGRGGTRFTRGFANTPLCCPARATLMTGQYPHNHGVWSNKDWEKLDQQQTLQNDLHAAGYRTAIFGKYLNHFPVETTPPPAFERFAVFRSGGTGTDSGYYSGGTWNVDGNVGTVDTYSSHFIEQQSADFIRAESDAPWFMLVSLPAPHNPFTPEPRYASAPVGRWRGNPAVREKNRSDKPPWMSEFDAGVRRGRTMRRKQLRALMSVDDVVGSLSSALGETGQAENTLAFFTTDNSFLWGEHGMLGKPSPYLPSIKVPFYARWPGRIPARNSARRLVSHIDITATAYEAAGVAPEHQLDGYSLLGRHRRERLLTEMMVPAKGQTIPPWSSLLTRSGDHYVEYRSGEDLSFQELYELKDDPWELRNVAPRRLRKVAGLAALLSAVRACRASSCP